MELKHNEIINKYTIIKTLGKGAMGQVYLARDKNLNLYAIKELTDETSVREQEIALKSIQREGELLKAIKHKGLPTFHKTFENNRKLYIVMEYIEGDNLEDIIQGTSSPLDIRRVLTIGIQLCEILYYLHNLKPPVIYRDIKPSNIIINKNGFARLIDFGIARQYVPEKLHDTMRLGTPGYAAPEQYTVKEQSNQRSDVYSLGVLLYQLLTQHDPTLTPLKFPHMKTLNPTIPGIIVSTIEKSINLAPEMRYENMDLLKKDLLDYYKKKYGPFLKSYMSEEAENISISREIEKSTKKKKKIDGSSKKSFLTLLENKSIFQPPPRFISFLLALQILLGGKAIYPFMSTSISLVIMFSLIYIGGLGEAYNFRKNMGITKGRVTAVNTQSHKNKSGETTYVYEVSYTFTGPDNKIYSGLCYSARAGIYRGQEVEIEYIKNDFSVSRIKNMERPTPKSAIFCLFPFCFLVLFHSIVTLSKIIKENFIELLLLITGKVGYATKVKIKNFYSYEYNMELKTDNGKLHKIIIKSTKRYQKDSNYPILYYPSKPSVAKFLKDVISGNKKKDLKPDYSLEGFIIFLAPSVTIFIISMLIYFIAF